MNAPSLGRLMAAAREISELLQSHGWKFSLIGGLAVTQRGEPRSTRDVDISLLAPLGEESPMIEQLLQSFDSRLEDAFEFALNNRVLLLQASNGIAIDIALATFPFEEQMIDRSTWEIMADDWKLPVLTSEDLIVMKSFSGRAQDWADIDNLARNSGTINWLAVDERLTQLAELIDLEDVRDRLNRVARSAR